MLRSRPLSTIVSRTGLSARVRVLVSREVWLATAFLLLNALLGVFWFVALVTLISLGLGLAYTLIGLVILGLTMRFWMAGATLERRRAGLLLGTRIAPPYRALPERGILARALARAGDPATWRDLLYLVLLFPLGIGEGALVVVAWLLPLGGLLAPLWLPYGSAADTAQPSVVLASVAALPAALAGLALLLLLPRVLLAVARRHGALALALLGPTASRERTLAARVDELRASRSRLLDAALLERQRIERDLHDGAQQRLVAVAMGLGLARGKMQSDPAAAAALVIEAHEQTKLALRDIRDLVRGIHPAVLSDRGLDPAISALAGRCPIPVEVRVDLDHRPPEAVESTAYFVVAEALTNIAKHSAAAHAWIGVSCARGRLLLEIRDDGVGGAAPAAGGGLAGLADRVAALDGRLVVASPAGGPTIIRAELPCE